MELRNKQLTEDEFFSQRKEVLEQWPTGKGVRFEEAVEYQKGIALEKRFCHSLDLAREQGRTLIQPRAGVALYTEHIKLLQYLEGEGEADLLPSTIDSYTRLNRYEEAEKGIERSKETGRSMLNGFPAVNYGVETCRVVSSSVKRPIQVRHGTPDARLLCEITVAGGFTSFEGGGISYNIPYSKNHSLEKTIAYWQYVDRLIGLYGEAGVCINREPFGPLTGTLVPPGISGAVAVLEALLAAEQGVKDITVGYGQCGNLVQDVAAICALEKVTRAWMDRFGFMDARISTVFHQWMGGFPQDEARAFGVIAWGAATAALSKATKVIVKSPHEAMGVPTREANAAGLKTTRQVASMLRDQTMRDNAEVLAESTIIEAEMECILRRVEELGNGDLAQGTVAAFMAGVIDVPFAPSRCNMGKAMPARDSQGAVRFLDVGNIPLNDELKALHREKMAERGRLEGRPVNFQMLVDDVYAISKGFLVGKPSGSSPKGK
jgi:methylaspartate mutase epsilon subunit